MGVGGARGAGQAGRTRAWAQGRGGSGNASCALQGKGNQLWYFFFWHRINFSQFWVEEVGQTGTLARHSTQNGQKCSNTLSPFKSTVHKGNNSPCSMIITQIALRRICVPSDLRVRIRQGPSAVTGGALGSTASPRAATALPGH